MNSAESSELLSSSISHSPVVTPFSLALSETYHKLPKALPEPPVPMSTNFLATLPSWISRWLGYRAVPPPKRSDYVVWCWSFVGAFCAISVIQAVFEQAQYFVQRKVPTIVASYGASAVLVYGTVELPFAQPRALFGGHFFGALIGVIISKLFLLLPTEQRFEDLAWLAASLSCALSVVVMQITQTIHPPAGATALLPAVNAEIREMGWYYLPVVLLSSALALGVALVINNIQRRYPVFWIQPVVPPKAVPAPSVAPVEEKPVIAQADEVPTPSDVTRSNSNSAAERKPVSDASSAV